jgi:hypothetical protein
VGRATTRAQRHEEKMIYMNHALISILYGGEVILSRSGRREVEKIWE